MTRDTREIEVIVNPDGSVSVEAIGYEGPDCEEATRFLEQTLGTVQERRRKPEYYRRQRSGGRVRQR